MKGKVKILHVGYGGMGGLARVIVNLAVNHSSGFDVAVIFLGRVLQFQYINELMAMSIKCFFILRRNRFDSHYIYQFHKVVDLFGPDIVVFHTPVLWLSGVNVFLKTGLHKRIVSVQHYPSWGLTFLSFLSNLQIVFRANKVVCVSRAVENYFRRFMFLSKKLVVVENGVSVRPIVQRNLMKRNIVFITIVARLDIQKDHRTLLKAIKLVTEMGYCVFLRIVGDGPLKESLIKMSRALRLEEHISFLGNRMDVRNILLDTDLFVLTTHAEGLPMSILEAMEAGCPVIATKVAGVVQIVNDGENGVLVPPRDHIYLAQAIAGLINQPSRAINIARKGRELIESKFNIIDATQKYEMLFSELVDSGKIS